MSKFNECLNIRGMSDNEKTPSISNFRLQFAIIFFLYLKLIHLSFIVYSGFHEIYKAIILLKIYY